MKRSLKKNFTLQGDSEIMKECIYVDLEFKEIVELSKCKFLMRFMTLVARIMNQPVQT